MATYVDGMRSAPWRYGKACHMVADTLDELHQMADAIGLKRSWFQSGSRPHYDLTTAKRKEAIAMGAKPITARELVTIIRNMV